MIRYAAFLRGLNTVGSNFVSMEQLQEYFAIPGLENIRVLIQPDNVLFESDETDEDKLSKTIEAHLLDKLGYEIKVIIRMVHELKNIIRNNPFDHINSDDIRNLYVTFLSATPPASVRGALEVHSNDAEDARLVKREVYVLAANYGKSRFSNAMIEKKFGLTATTRNWYTLNKLVEQ